jgi:hypothetical protein
MSSRGNSQLKGMDMRNTLKNKLAQLPKINQTVFKRMYSHGNLAANINEVVDQMSANNLNWAITQATRTLDKQKEMK